MIRVLRGPDGGEGGGNPPPVPAPNPQPPPPQTPPPSPTPTPVPPPQGVLLTPEQHKALLDGIAERDRLKAEETARETKRREAEEESARKRGDFEKIITERDKALAERDRKLADIEERSKRSERKRELALAIAGSPIVEGWSDHLMKLWEDQFEVIADGDSWKVKTLDGKTPGEFVKAQLARPEFNHIVRAQTSTGATNRGSTTGRTDEAPSNPASPGQQAFDHWQQMKEERARYGFGSVGLKPVAKSS